MGKEQNLGYETKILYKILKFVLFALLLTPIWVWSGFLFPFITSKVVYFRLGVELALVFYLPLALKYPGLRPQWNWLTRMVWIYLGVMLVMSIFGVNFYKSFWGTLERGEGVLTMLHFGVYFSMLTAVFQSKRDWRRYITVALIVISFTGVLSIGQMVCGPGNYNGLCTFVPPAQGSRISATIGNSAFYAAFMLFGMFLSLLLGFESTNRLVKFVFFSNAIFNALLLVSTQTRGGAIALYIGVFILVVFHALRGQARALKMIAAVLGAFMVLIPTILILKPQIFPERVREIVVVRRILRISINDITTQSRLDTWKASWLGWKDRFWTGYGYENYNIAFNKYFPPRIFKAAGSQIWFDRAHNTVLDVAVTSGIVGIIVYFGIFYISFRILYRLFRAPKLPARSAVILAALLVGYFVQNLFVFDTHATYLMFFLVLAHLVFLENTELTQARVSNGRQYDAELPALVVVALVMVVAGYFVNVRPALANHAAITTIKSVREGQYQALEPGFRKALSYGTYMDEEIRQHMVDYFRQANSSGKLTADQQNTLIAFISSELEKNLVASPLDTKNHLYLMNFYNATAQRTNKIDRVFDLGRQATILSPTRMQIYFELGQATLLIGRTEDALEYFRKAVALNPQPKESHLNYLMAAIYSRRPDIAEQELRELKNWEHKLTMQEEANLANAFGQICDLKSARQHAQAAIVLEPKFAADAQTFLAQLEKTCQGK